MSSITYRINNCRICDDTNLIDVIKLGKQSITSRFPKYGDFSTPKTDITLCICKNCGLLQLRETTNSNELYEHEYGYCSGTTNTMRKHLKEYNEEIVNKIHLNENDVVMDIGSNDSTMLQYYSKILKRIGVDPTGKQFKKYYGDIDLIENYFTKENFINLYGNIKCKVISSISMFYDLPQPVQFAKDVYDCLDEDGIWTCEQSYVVSMLNTKSFDTICHEHLEYYALHQIKEIADRSNFKIIDVKFNNCNGGSFRIYFAKKSSNKYTECNELLNDILYNEKNLNINDPKTYIDFIKNCDIEINKLKYLINIINKNNKKLYLYGASTKGNCLLQYANIDNNMIKYAVERNLKKIGKMTSTGIEIISEETMRLNPPDYLLVLPWHFKDEIIERENIFLKNGGQLIFPLPYLDIVSLKPKTLITGCNGHIASYLYEEIYLSNSLYGIGKTIINDNKNILVFDIDINDDLLENILSITKPEAIIHLAGISSSIKAFHNPYETLKTNGLVISKICDIIHKNKWNTALINTSSSEMYKDHINYIVKEDDTNYKHLHPYSIAKIMGHSIINFYRNTYNLPFSNAILFTTESYRKNKDFLLNKVANHAKNWKIYKQPLYLGNLDSYRNIIHAKDVVSALITILKNEADTYLVCNTENAKIIDIVLEIYKLVGIELIRNNNILYDIIENLPVIIIGENLKEIDKYIVNINATPEKLLNLKWHPSHSIKDIIKDIVNN